MTIGANVSLRGKSDTDASGGRVLPIGLSSPWTTVIGAGGLATVDNAAITNPTTQITAATTTPFDAPDGTYIQARVLYDANLTSVTSPVVVLFGRKKGASQLWQRIYNKADTPATAVTMTMAVSTDITDAAFNTTDVDPKSHTWDKQGCDEFVFGIQTALNGTGTKTNCVLQARAF